MGKLCCSTKDSEFARGPGKSKGTEDDEIDSIASHSMNVNDSLHLEYAKKLQAQRGNKKGLKGPKMVRSASHATVGIG